MLAIILIFILLTSPNTSVGTEFTEMVTDSLDSILNSEGLFPKHMIVLYNGSFESNNNFQSIIEDSNILDHAYTTYVARFRKPSVSKEQRFRKKIFQNNLLTIFHHNLKVRAENSSFEMGVNAFTDLTSEEIERDYMGYKPSAEENKGNYLPFLLDKTPDTIETDGLNIPYGDVSDSLDWRLNSSVSPIKDQRGCGNCVIFAATACLESYHAMWNQGEIVDLSEQELFDCSICMTLNANRVCGCNSGHTMDDPFNYLRDVGQGLEKDYPYIGVESGTCKLNASREHYKIPKWFRVRPSGDENTLKLAVANYGPVAVAIFADAAFKKYASGIFESENCKEPSNHAVLVVGYDTENGKDYWIVKNSWGSDWGEEGFVRMRRNFMNLCNIADSGVYISSLK